MDAIESTFNERFSACKLELPKLSLAGRTPGILTNGIWNVLFRFYEDGRGEYLDYFAYG